MITTIIFDMDDTLYDEVDYCKSGFKAVAEFLARSNPQLNDKANAEEIFAVLWGQFSAGNHTTTFNAALDELGISYDSGFIPELVKVYRNHIPTIALPVN